MNIFSGLGGAIEAFSAYTNWAGNAAIIIMTLLIRAIFKLSEKKEKFTPVVADAVSFVLKSGVVLCFIFVFVQYDGYEALQELQEFLSNLFSVLHKKILEIPSLYNSIFWFVVGLSSFTGFLLLRKLVKFLIKKLW